MHRCVLSHALPNRARPVSLRLGIPVGLRLSAGHWPSTARRWRNYSTTVEGSRQDEAAQPLGKDLKQSCIDARLDGLETEASSGLTPAEAEEKDNGRDAALEFILAGYEAQPEHDTQPGRRRHVREASAERTASPGRHRSKLLARQRTMDEGVAKAANTARITEKRNRSARPSPSGVEGTLIKRIRPPVRKASRKVTLRPRVDALWARPKWITFFIKGTNTSALNTAWNQRFARVQNHYDKVQRGRRYMMEPPVLDSRTQEWVGILQQRMDESQDLALRGLAERYKADKDFIWMHVAIWLLQHDKDRLVDLLHVSTSSTNEAPPANWVIDCLQLLCIHYPRAQPEDVFSNIEKLVPLFCAIAQTPAQGRVRIDGRFIRMLLPVCTGEQINSLYRALKVGSVQMHSNTYLHLASHFAKNEHFHQGIDAVLEAHRAGAHLSSSAFRSVCATLIRKAMEQPGGMRTCLRIVDNLVNIGLRLNTQLCNILVLNAVEAGDLKTAFSIYHSLVQHDVQADKYTYAILLKGCKLHNADADTLLETIRHAIASTEVLQSPVLATEILHCLTLHHTQHNPENAWSTVCQAYAQLFSLQPLLDLDLPLASTVQSTPIAQQPIAPPPHALGIMLHAYIHLSPPSQHALARTHTLYTNFRFLADARTEPWHTLAQSDHAYNTFLSAFTAHRRTLVHAAQVIKDMQRTPTSPDPTVYSWSIFLHGFTRHKQVKLAEQVVAYMQKKGIEPNEVTWKTLMAGYAGTQDVDGLVDAVGRAERAGVVWEEWSGAGLGRVRDREGFFEKLRKRRGEGGVGLDFTGELKEGLVRKFGEGGGG